ncbi:MAG: dihydrolipoamide acetyltransferase family protein [Planctomycetota bacterium]
MPREFLLPDLGEGIHEAQIVRVMIKPGDQIQEDQYLMEVETDKAAVEIPSPFMGIAQTVHVHEGQTVNVGDVIVTFDDSAGAVTLTAKPASSLAGTKAKAPTAISSPVQPAASVSPSKTSAAAAPAIRKMAREMNVDIDGISGSGPGGRVTKEDVEGAAKKRSQPVLSGVSAAPIPRREAAPRPVGGVADVDKWGPIRRVPLTQIRKTIAEHMAKSVYTIPHVTHGDEADIFELERVRKSLNEATGGDPKLTVLTFVIRALCVALRKYPEFNSSFDKDGGQMIYKDYIGVGVAVDSERGLVVPVIRDADRLTLRGIAGELTSIAERVRTNKFGIEDYKGGTFTVTNVGALGGTFSTPIINHPEVAILGLGRARKVPVFRNGAVAEGLMLPLNLSFDHRATDGANASRLTREIIGYLETPGKFMLD